MVSPISLTPVMPSLGGVGGADKYGDGSGDAPGVQGAFGGVLNLVEQAMDSQKNAQAMSMAAANGENVPMHKVIEAISQAELTLQTLVTVRDRAVEAYQQIQQMPI